MRALGAAYTDAVTGRESRPLVRVLLAGHGGAFDDPFDVTDHILSCEVERPLRSANAATIRLVNETGQFDPVSGVYAAAIAPANAEVQIDMGELIDGVATYWRVMTGEIHTADPNYNSDAPTIDLEVLDRGRNPWQYVMTSPLFYDAGTTPVYVTCHDIVRGLFEEFAELVAPGDFNLDPASDWQLDRAVQFEQEALAPAACKCLQAVGYRMWFDYQGRVTSARLIPAGAPGTWAVDGVILDDNVERIDGPSASKPNATRVRIVGGKYPWPMWNIGEPALWASATYRHDDTGAIPPAVGGGDCYWAEQGINDRSWWYHIQGPIGKSYRMNESYLEVEYEAGGAADFVTVPRVQPGGEAYNFGWDRQTILIRFYQTVGTNVDMTLNVFGYPLTLVNHQVFSQAWDEGMRAQWGETSHVIDNPLIYTWNQGEEVSEQEMTISVLSLLQASVALKRLDLRVEAGDVWTVENPKGADFTLWVRRVSHGVAPERGETFIEGYVIP